MSRAPRLFLCCGLLLTLTGCAAYRPQPLHPVASVAAFRRRSLDDPGLRAFVARQMTLKPAQWPPARFDLPALTLAAFYFNPDLAQARAAAASAAAAIITAGEHPNPTVSLAPEYSEPLAQAPSPWTMGLSFDFPIETAHKRSDRIAQAQALTQAARLEVAQTAWQVRSRLRRALMEHLVARRERALWRRELAARAGLVQMLEHQLMAGQISVVEVDNARIALNQAQLALAAAQGQVLQTRATLAAAIGLPVSALKGLALDRGELDHLPAPQTILRGRLQQAGLLNRLDVRASLARYAAAEAALQLEVAKQYPDLDLGPGYQWDQGIDHYILGLTLEVPLLNQNQGPIAQARARRHQAAVAFRALQARVIGQLEEARASYLAAAVQLAQADRLLAIQEAAQRTIAHRLAAGQDDRLALLGAQVQTAVAASARLDALAQTQAALGALEDAVERPLAATPTKPLEVRP